MFKPIYNRSSQQLVAHCLFAKGHVEYNCYEKYYNKDDNSDG